MPSSWTVNLRDIYTILAKEIRYALRDPDVIIYGVIFPLVFYPMVLIGIAEVGLWVGSAKEKKLPAVAVLQPDSALAKPIVEALRSSKEVRYAGSAESKDLTSGDIIALVNVAKNSYELEITLSPKADPLTRLMIERVLESARSKTIREQLKKQGIVGAQLSAFKQSFEAFAPSSLNISVLVPKKDNDGLNIGLGVICGITLVQIALAGATASMCAIAEEREKRTLYTTLLLPIPRVRLVCGKLLAAIAIGLGSGSLNLIGIALTIAALVVTVAIHAQSMPPPAFLASLAGLSLPLAAMTMVHLVVSSVFMISLFMLTIVNCKTFKEAQTILTLPLMMIFPLPFIAYIPGLELTVATAFVPVLNLSLSLKRGGVPSDLFLLSALVDVIYSALLIWLVTRYFGRFELSAGEKPLFTRLGALAK